MLLQVTILLITWIFEAFYFLKLCTSWNTTILVLLMPVKIFNAILVISGVLKHCEKILINSVDPVKNLIKQVGFTSFPSSGFPRKKIPIHYRCKTVKSHLCMSGTYQLYSLNWNLKIYDSILLILTEIGKGQLISKDILVFQFSQKTNQKFLPQ